jgi:hypothetical protein
MTTITTVVPASSGFFSYSVFAVTATETDAAMASVYSTATETDAAAKALS